MARGVCDDNLGVCLTQNEVLTGLGHRGARAVGNRTRVVGALPGAAHEEGPVVVEALQQGEWAGFGPRRKSSSRVDL